MVKENYITIPQLAKMMGLSRIEVFKKVKKGDEIYIRHTEALAVSVEKP